MIFLILINTTIFILLSFLHIYWALGGNRGMSDILPTLSDGQRRFRTGTYARLTVGAAMGGFAFITIGNMGIFNAYLSRDFIRYATTAIGVVFLLRAVGDFRYIGFFKKATGTRFARNDSRYYIPLSITIAVISFIIAWAQVIFSG